jgi:uncharacterized membrane protein (UPF0182 family)
VIRGNLLVLPIGNSLLYVEPLYLRAENGQIPELKRVILATGDKIVMEESLAEALLRLFEDDEGPLTSAASTSPAAEEPLPSEPVQQTPVEEDASASEVAEAEELANRNIAELAQLASSHYEAAQLALKNEDWATYGAELERMEQALEALVQLAEGQ